MRVKATDIFKLILYYKQAVDWYTKSANQSNPLVQNNLGWMYDN